MTLPELGRGDRIKHDDYNALVREYNNAQVIKPDSADTYAPLYGICATDAPAYSVFGIYSGATQQNVDQPCVNIAPIGSTGNGFPFAIVTNGPYAASASKRVPVTLVAHYQAIKLDVPTGDSGFAVGKPCGPKFNSLQTSSTGVGFVCLVGPQTYATSKKFIWACSVPLTSLKGKTTSTVTAGTTAPVSATIKVQSFESGSLVDDFDLEAYNVGPALASGASVMLIPVFGLGYTIVTAGSSLDVRRKPGSTAASGAIQKSIDGGTTWTDLFTWGTC